MDASAMVKILQSDALLLTDAAVADILPVGGVEILNAKESIAKNASKEAQELLAKTLTENALAGIRSLSILKYVLGFAPMMKADKGKKSKELIDVTKSLRAWGAANALYLQALNERLNNQVTSDIEAAAKLLKTLGVDAPSTESTVADISALKEAETKLLLAQVDPKGGGSFKLDEFRGVGKTSVSKITWYGPVSSRVRVAKLTDNPDKVQVEQLKELFGKLQSPVDELPLDKIPEFFPVPDIAGGKFYDWVNPQFSSAVPASADILHFDGYQYAGMNKGPAPWNDTKPFDLNSLFFDWYAFILMGPLAIPLVYGTSSDYKTKAPKTKLQAIAEYMALLYEQLAREQSLTKKSLTIDTLQAKIEGKTAYTPAVYSFGYMIDVGLTRDPEWGSTNIFKRRTPHWVADTILPKIRNWHQTRRIQLSLKGDGSNQFKAVGEAAIVQAKQAAIKGAIVDLAILPPLPILWKKDSVGVLNYGPASIEVWQQYVNNNAMEVHLNFLTSVQTWNKRYWGGKGPDNAKLIAEVAETATPEPKGLLAKWNPTGKTPLPYPLVYSLDKIEPLLPKYVAISGKEWSDISDNTTPEQDTVISLRSEYKSSLLIGMRAAEFAESVFSDAEQLFAAIQSIAELLYGSCPLTPAPKDMPKEKLYAHYVSQTDACAASPKDGSLCSVLSKAEVLYSELKAKSEAGDKAAKSQALVVSEKIAKTQERVNVLIAELKGKLTLAKSDMASEGGVFFYTNIVFNALNFLAKVPVATIGNIKVSLPPSKEEAEATEALKEKLILINAKSLDFVGKLGAFTETLKKTAETYGVDLPTSVSVGLDDVANWSKRTLGEEQKKKFPWLLLLAAAAAARSEK